MFKGKDLFILNNEQSKAASMEAKLVLRNRVPQT